MNRNGSKETAFPYDLRELGKLYDNDAFSEVDLLDFQYTLDQSDQDNADGLFDSKAIMESVSFDMYAFCVGYNLTLTLYLCKVKIKQWCHHK